MNTKENKKAYLSPEADLSVLGTSDVINASDSWIDGEWDINPARRLELLMGGE